MFSKHQLERLYLLLVLFHRWPIVVGVKRVRLRLEFWITLAHRYVIHRVISVQGGEGFLTLDLKHGLVLLILVEFNVVLQYLLFDSLRILVGFNSMLPAASSLVHFTWAFIRFLFLKDADPFVRQQVELLLIFFHDYLLEVGGA